MLSRVFLVFTLFILAEGTTKGQNKAYSPGRQTGLGAHYANFKAHINSYLAVKKVDVVFVDKIENCGLACILNFLCFSFNIAIKADNSGQLLCELLATDKYTASSNFTINGTFHHYSIVTACLHNPCQNDATCVPNYEENSFKCICQAGYKGELCETAVADLVSMTCSHLKSLFPDATSGSYAIDPDGSGGDKKFFVDCDMTDKGGVGVTVVHHDTESRTLVDGVAYQRPGSYVRSVSYNGTTLEQLAQLTRVSANCEQFIRYECYDSRLRRDDMGWWVARDGTKMTNWGGAPDFSNKCACGVNGSCADPSYYCNCDKNDYVWRHDSGFLTSKDKLPVIQLRFGDVGYSDSDAGYHTLGKFKCYGKL